MAKDNLTKTANVAVTAREVDFVSRFQANWDGLLDIMGVSRPIRKTPGVVLKSKVATVSLENSVGEGEEIPYSLATVNEVPYAEVGIEKYAKAVSIEAIKDHGYDVAVAKTDNAFLNQLQSRVMNMFYTYLATGSNTGAFGTFQMALARAKGNVLAKFKALQLDVTEVVGFVNINDFYSYLGAAEITVQTQFGMTYIQNFLGYRVIFLCGDNEVAPGKVIATPVENVVFYYVDPSDSDFAKAGLEYTTVGVTPLIGFHTVGNYGTAVSECFAILGLVLFAEYLDGIAVIDIGSESFTAVVSPSGNPAAQMYYEKSGDKYFRTTDTTVVSGKTYYSRTVTPAA